MQRILVIGIDHILPKIARHYKMISDMTGFEVIISSLDVSGYSQRVAERYGVKWVPVPAQKEAILPQFISLLMRVRPIHAELYHDFQNDWIHLCRILAVRMLRIPIVAVCRGGELLYWNKHSTRRKIIYRFGLRQAKIILYKELHMPLRLRQLRIPQDCCHFFYNRVPVGLESPPPLSTRSGVLHLNSWKPWRHPEIAVKVAMQLGPKYPTISYWIGGARSFHEEKIIAGFRKQIEKTNLKNQIYFLPFVEDVESLLRKCSIFLLPAEVVFLNYTLIEAMERGLVPVIAKVEGAERIVNHGKDGLIVDLTADAFVKAVDYLLSHPTKMEKMAQSAREKVRDRFNLRDGLEGLIKIYRREVW